MVAYVLLIVIAISLSILVYAWLKIYVIKPTPACHEGVSLIIYNYECDSVVKNLSLTVQNQGTFGVDGFVIRIANEEGMPAIHGLEALGPEYEDMEKGYVLFPGEQGLLPVENHDKMNINFTYEEYEKIVKVEIEPIEVNEETDRLLLCEGAIISQELEGCT